MHHPAHNAAREERNHHRHSCNAAPEPGPAHELVQIKARRSTLKRRVTRAYGLCLRAPLRHPARIFGMTRKPGLYRRHPFRWKLAVDIGVQLVLRHRCLIIAHASISFTSPGAMTPECRRETP